MLLASMCKSTVGHVVLLFRCTPLLCQHLQAYQPPTDASKTHTAKQNPLAICYLMPAFEGSSAVIPVTILYLLCKSSSLMYLTPFIHPLPTEPCTNHLPVCYLMLLVIVGDSTVLSVGMTFFCCVNCFHESTYHTLFNHPQPNEQVGLLTIFQYIYIYPEE